MVSAAARKLASSATAMKARRSARSKFMFMAHQSYAYLQFTVYPSPPTIPLIRQAAVEMALSEVSIVRYVGTLSRASGTLEGGVVKFSKLYRTLYFQVL